MLSITVLAFYDKYFVVEKLKNKSKLPLRRELILLRYRVGTRSFQYCRIKYTHMGIKYTNTFRIVYNGVRLLLISHSQTNIVIQFQISFRIVFRLFHQL